MPMPISSEYIIHAEKCISKWVIAVDAPEINMEVGEDKIKFIMNDFIITFQRTSEGYMIGPSWNDTHLTIIEQENVVDLHTSIDGGNPTGVNRQFYSSDEFLSDIYPALRALGAVTHISDFDQDQILSIDFDKMIDQLQNIGAIEINSQDVNTDTETLNKFIQKYSEGNKEIFKKEFMNEIAIVDACDSEDALFYDPKSQTLLLAWPDGLLIDVDLSIPEEVNSSDALRLLLNTLSDV